MCVYICVCVCMYTYMHTHTSIFHYGAFILISQRRYRDEAIGAVSVWLGAVLSPCVDLQDQPHRYVCTYCVHVWLLGIHVLLLGGS